MRIYLSGPITGVEDYHLNFLKAENQVRDIFKNDEVINPMWMGNMLPGGSHEEYMTLCFALVGMADKMVMLDGWQQSQGACMERSLAEEMGVEVLEIGASGEIKACIKKSIYA